MLDELGDPLLILENASLSDEGLYYGVIYATVGENNSNIEYEFEIEVLVDNLSNETAIEENASDSEDNYQGSGIVV